MLPRGSRLSTASEFAAVVRRGSTAARPTIVVHVGFLAPSRRVAGFAVSRAVGGAVVRNLVKRRLRAILATALPTVPDGVGVVVRALPRAATAPYTALERDVTAALEQALRRLEP